MHSKKLLTVQEIFQASPKFKAIQQKLKNIAELNAWIQAHIDPDFINMCQVTNLNQTHLVLSTKSSVLGHQLRFAKLTLLQQLKGNPKWKHLNAIEIKVQPGTNLLKSQAKNLDYPVLPSCQSIALMEGTAMHIDNANLRAALLSFCARVKRQQSQSSHRRAVEPTDLKSPIHKPQGY